MATLAQLLIELKNTQTTLDEFGAIKIKELKEQIFECDANLKGFELVRESLKESLDEEKNRLKELKKERMDLLNAMIKDVNREPPKTKPEPPKAKPEPPKTKSEPPKIRPEPPKTKPEPPKAKPEPPKIRPEPPKTKPESPKAKPEPPKSVEVKLPEKQVLENGSKKSQPPSKVIKDVNQEPPKTKSEPPKTTEVKLPEKEVIDLVLISDSSDSPNHIDSKKTKELTCKVLENGLKNSQPPSNMIQPPKKKMNPGPVNAKESTCRSPVKRPFMVQPPTKMNPGPVNAKESACRSPAKRPFMVQPKPNLSRKQKQLQAQAKRGKQPRDDKMIQCGYYPWGEPMYYKFSCEGKPLNRKDSVKWRTQVSKEKRKFEPGPFQCLCAQCGPKRSDSRFTGSNNAINKHHVEVYKPKFSCVRCGYYAATFHLNVIKGHLRKHEMDKEYI